MNKSLDKSSLVISLRYYFDRILRLIPIYYMSLYFYIIYAKYLVSDRFYDKRVVEVCDEKLVYNILFVGNEIKSTQMVNLNLNITVN